MPSVLRDAAVVLAQVALPAAVLLVAAWRDRNDGRPDYVVPWVVFAAIMWVAWTLPAGSPPPRLRRSPIDIPHWVWPWVALAGVLVFRR